MTTFVISVAEASTSDSPAVVPGSETNHKDVRVGAAQ